MTLALALLALLDANTVAVDTSKGHPISPYVFGMAYEKDRKPETWRQRPTLIRFGGNPTDRFNWKNNSYNAGNDWYFLNITLSPKPLVDAIVEENGKHGAASAVVLPLVGWVSKDGTSASFPIAKYPSQQQLEPYNKTFGNGIDKDGKPLVADPKTTSIPSGPAFLGEWVKHLKDQFGTSPHFYILGNEPMLWGETHRDVHPAPTTYDEYLDKYLGAAIAVRKADPNAVLIGPAGWGWLEVFQSEFDNRGPWSGGQKGVDKAKHGDVPFLEWFITQVKKKEDETGLQLLDVVDMHFYPQDQSLYQDGPYDAKNRALRLASTRGLWDRSWKDTSWIQQPTYYIPLLREIVTRTKPSLKLAIGEYNFHGENDLGGGVAVAEILRIFVDQGLYMAEYWADPPPGSPAAAGFRLFRNYDDEGNAFGDVRLDTNQTNDGDVTVVAGKSDGTRRVTVVLINKSVDHERTMTLRLDHFDPYVRATTSYTLSSKNPATLHQELLPPAKQVPLVLAPLSATLVEFKY